MQQHKEIKYISDYYITIQKYPDRKLSLFAYWVNFLNSISWHLYSMWIARKGSFHLPQPLIFYQLIPYFLLLAIALQKSGCKYCSRLVIFVSIWQSILLCLFKAYETEKTRWSWLSHHHKWSQCSPVQQPAIQTEPARRWKLRAHFLATWYAPLAVGSCSPYAYALSASASKLHCK